MVWTKMVNSGKSLLFIFVLAICIIVAAPFLIPQIQVGIFMFLSIDFWLLFFFMTSIWFIFGFFMWMRGFGRKEG